MNLIQKHHKEMKNVTSMCWTPRLVAFDNHRRFPDVVPDEMTNQLIGVTT